MSIARLSYHPSPKLQMADKHILNENSTTRPPPFPMLNGGEQQRHHVGMTDPETEVPSSPPRVLSIISHVLEKLVSRNDELSSGVGAGAATGRSLIAFHGVRTPSISLYKYVERIYKYTNCSPACFVVGFVYIDRLVHKYPDSLVLSINVHRLLVTSVMLASKILDDVHYNNAVYARVGGVSNEDINRLELEFLFLLDFEVYVSSRVFQSYCQYFDKEITSDYSDNGTQISTDDDTSN